LDEAGNDISPHVRAMLAKRCRSRRTRRAEFSSAAPTEWQPRTLRDPRAPEDYFTDDSAWEFVAECLESGCYVEVVELRLPPGKKGFVFKAASGTRGEHIYIKLQLGSETVIGRSFHTDYAVDANQRCDPPLMVHGKDRK
jgi:hypothetical protein